MIHPADCRCSKCPGAPLPSAKVRFRIIVALYLIGIVIGAAALLQGGSAL
ncbi:hypothetical protein [Blastomonas sp. CCH5-A3]|jgi:hypothetical protein|nr:hypothetical protein [Blastomonas sp. CCH5-A3]|tara:strand:- start:105650 stop:105799 length:150 start_codon:yes stop_codon:yes gene_type:complete